MPVIAARSPADAFDCAIEAVRIATQYMTPVMLLTDGYIANAAEPWRVPDMSGYAPFPVEFFTEDRRRGRERSGPMRATRSSPASGSSRGTPGLRHRIGGIEKNVGTGHIDYAPPTTRR
jgi:2-oxoglutarate ferredoxin oxidoreductase subunit alpha